MQEIIAIKKEWYFTFVNFLAEINELDKWDIPFFKTYNSDGEYELDGDPIFSMINHARDKIIKIIHEDGDCNFIKSTFDEIPMLICFSDKSETEAVLKECRLFINS